MKRRSDGRYLKIVDGQRFYGYSEREVYRKILEHTDRKIRGIKFSEVCEQWWSIEVSQLSPSTIHSYRKATDRVTDYFGSYPINEITTADITKFLHILARQDFAKKTVKNHKIIISRIMHFAVVECYITHNPARDAELPRNLSETKRKAATCTDEMQIKSTPLDAWQLPFFALFTGMRKGELIGLKWCDIDLTNDIITVSRSVWYGEGGSHIKAPKTDAGSRTIPIIDILKQRIEDMIATNRPKPSHYVFGNERPLSEKAYRYRMERYSKDYGISSTLHQLRKSFATAAVDAEIDPDVLKEIIGHKDITTTMNIYAEVRESRIKSAGKSLSNLHKNR